MSNVLNDFKGADGLWVKSVGTSGVDKVSTISHVKWKNMKGRCRVGGSEQMRQATYIGCTMSEEFSNFQKFTDWHVRQIGYGIDGYALEKDIIFQNNKIYSATTCVLVPQALNSFLVSCTSARGAYPQGVYLYKGSSFKAQINIGGKKTHLGYFSTSVEAYSVYAAAKEAEARRWYERLKAGEFVADERVIERMRTWTLAAI